MRGELERGCNKQEQTCNNLVFIGSHTAGTNGFLSAATSSAYRCYHYPLEGFGFGEGGIKFQRKRGAKGPCVPCVWTCGEPCCVIRRCKCNPSHSSQSHRTYLTYLCHIDGTARLPLPLHLERCDERSLTWELQMGWFYPA